jgi:hypothetical protein
MAGTILEDEFGYRWLVTEHMPEVSRLTSLLRRQGFRWLVLPRRTIRTGALTETLPAIPKGLAPDSLRRMIRLRQCVFALKGSR